MFDYTFYKSSNSHEDIDATSKFFSYIVKLLKIDDHVIINRTLEMVDYILEKEGSREKAVKIPRMVASLVDILHSSSDRETIKFTLKILLSLSQCQTGLSSIYQSNGIPVLIELLSEVESLVSLAVVTLHNLLLNQEGSKTAVCEAGGLQKMASLLKFDNENFLSVVISCLHILAYRNQENKLLIFSSGGPTKLVRIINTHVCEALLYNTSRLLKVLSSCSSNKRAIIAAGGMHALVKHLNNPSTKLAFNCLLTLRNLSDALNKEKNVTPVLKILVNLLRNRDKAIVTCTAGILSNMTCNNTSNKVIISKEMDISALVNAVVKAGNAEEALEPAIRTLRHLTCHHSEAETAQNNVRLCSGLQPIVKLLKPLRGWPLIKAAIGLVRNLALCPNNHEPLLALGTINLLHNMLNFIYLGITRNQGGLLCNKTQATVESIKMKDAVEGILIALLNLTGNAKVRASMKDDNIIDTLVTILYKEKENETIQCIITSLFCKISSDRSGILAVESAGTVPFLCTSLNSENESLASQSRSLLVLLYTIKPKEYGFLSKDLYKIM